MIYTNVNTNSKNIQQFALNDNMVVLYSINNKQFQCQNKYQNKH